MTIQTVLLLFRLKFTFQTTARRETDATYELYELICETFAFLLVISVKMLVVLKLTTIGTAKNYSAFFLSSPVVHWREDRQTQLSG